MNIDKELQNFEVFNKNNKSLEILSEEEEY